LERLEGAGERDILGHWRWLHAELGLADRRARQMVRDDERPSIIGQLDDDGAKPHL
jgi:hypothetical protein